VRGTESKDDGVYLLSKKLITNIIFLSFVEGRIGWFLDMNLGSGPGWPSGVH
jgi:hypothetical protein